MSKTIKLVIDTLSTKVPLSIGAMHEQYRCPRYDIIMALLYNGLIQIVDKEFKLTKCGIRNSSNRKITNTVWNEEVCQLVLHTLLFSKYRCPERLGVLIERHYFGEQMIESMDVDGGLITIKMRTV